MSEKPKCYTCKHRRNVPGDAHSSCAHPANAQANEDPLLQILGIFASVGRVDPVQAETGLNVKGHPTGIRRGWFNWPWNFDPTWLLKCDEWEAKE